MRAQQLAPSSSRPAAAARWRASTGSAVSSAAHSLGQRRVLGAGDGDLAFERAAAADEEFVHGWRRTAGERASARVSAAGGSGAGLLRPLGGRQRLHRQRVDLLAHSIAERRVDALVARDRGSCPRTRSETMVAKKWRPSPSTSRCSQARPAAMKRSMSAAVGSAIGRCYRVRARRHAARAPRAAARQARPRAAAAAAPRAPTPGRRSGWPARP